MYMCSGSGSVVRAVEFWDWHEMQSNGSKLEFVTLSGAFDSGIMH